MGRFFFGYYFGVCIWYCKGRCGVMDWYILVVVFVGGIYNCCYKMIKWFFEDICRLVGGY